jgi:hypothetical protein
MSGYSTLGSYSSTTLRAVEERYSHQLGCGGNVCKQKGANENENEPQAQRITENYGSFSFMGTIRNGVAMGSCGGGNGGGSRMIGV